MSERKSNSGGIGFFGLLTILFIGLKLTGAIDWSWWWVLAPLWVPFLLLVSVLLIWLVAWCVIHYQETKGRKR
jgi:hypothetical protein